MIQSDKFFVGYNPFMRGGLWCSTCLATGRRPALIHEWPGEATQNLADLVSRSQAHWGQVHDDREDP